MSPHPNHAELIQTIEALRLELAEERERIGRELDFARGIQEQFLPAVDLRLPCLEAAASMLPARLLSGDLYLVENPDGEHLTITVGDVAGKGIPASLLMVLAHEKIAMMSERALPPHVLLEEMNQWLAKRFSSDRFLTLLRAEIDLKAMRLSVSAGGHPPALLYRPNEDRFLEIGNPGVVLGPFVESRYETNDYTLHKGDVLVFISDGIVDMENSSGITFGPERLKEIIKKADYSKAQILHQSIFAAIQSHAEGTVRTDDATLVTVVIKAQKNT